MILSGKHILLISPEPWDHIFVSKHHYAIHLARRGNRVFFLNPPRKYYSLKVTPTRYENLNVISYDGFIPGLRFLPAPVQRFFIRRKFKQMEKLIKVELDIVWSFDNSVFYDFAALPNRVRTISHIVDLNQNFQFARAAKTSDFCFCVMDSLQQKMLEYNDQVHFINHGLSFNAEKTRSESPGTNSLKAIYVGNLAMAYLDWNILYQAVHDCPQVDFVFVGPNANEFSVKRNYTHSSKEKLSKLNNAYFIGRIDSKNIQGQLTVADILLVSYQEAFHAEQANPHKMMEYLASGKPIVATFTKEYAHLNGVILMSKKNSEWPRLFQQVVENLEQYSHPEMAQMRKAYALDNTYDKQLDRIEKILGKAAL